MTTPVDERIVRVLLGLAATAVVAALLCGWGWHRAATRRLDVRELSPEQRQSLTEEIISTSPGTHEAAWFEPRIAYTLKRGRKISAWNDTFTTNELGYRTGPAAKAPGTFRVVFVGDSWTFGLGVKEEESYPKVFERIANQASGLDRRVEAWTLALPGYNTLAETAALWFFFERLRPDAIVVAPTRNDNHSMSSVLPNGSATRSGVRRDGFGDDHVVTYQVGVNSHRFLARWRRCFHELRVTERHLQKLGIPLMIFFIARWEEPFPHRFVQESGLESPYLIAPIELTLGEWRNPPPYGHANPAANRLFGRMIYQGLAEVLGWPRLSLAGDNSDVALHHRPPPTRDWIAVSKETLAENTRRHIPESFRPSPEARLMCAGPMDPATGLMQRATTVLVRKAEGARRLRIAVRRDSALPSLYPLQLTVSLPSPSGGSRVVTTVPAEGSPVHRFTLAIPEDVVPATALDVVFRAARTAAAPRVLAPRSVFIESIDQDTGDS